METISPPAATDMNVEDRANMLRVIAERWDSTLHLFETGTNPVLYDYMAIDMLTACAAHYAHPLLDRPAVAENMSVLRDAVNALRRFELDGYPPDSFYDDEDGAACLRSNDEIMSLLNEDVDMALAPLIHGVSTARLCFRCQRQNASVTTWREPVDGGALCSKHLAEKHGAVA